MMYGQLKSTVKCLECKHTSVAFDPFLILPLPVPNQQSMNKVNFFKATLIPYEMYSIIEEDNNQGTTDYEDSESNANVWRNPNKSAKGSIRATPHQSYNFKYDERTTVM